MKSLLYISNIEVPYRNTFFNELSKYYKLTVVYERKKSSNRNSDWTSSVKPNYSIIYSNNKNIKKENGFSLDFIRFDFNSFDYITIGCVNSPYQIAIMLYLKFIRKKFYLNLDGKQFLSSGIKNNIKKIIIEIADAYLVAGYKEASQIKNIIKDKPVYPYAFSSLTDSEIIENSSSITKRENDHILVIGQYFEYKGLDVCVKAINGIPNIRTTIVRTGNRTDIFLRECNVKENPNIEVIPFLQKAQLNELYKTATILVLPSRKECWGLVINEAASFGLPIVSTFGSGAAVEFMSEKYDKYLAKPNDAFDLRSKINSLIDAPTKEYQEYSQYLKNKSKQYSIEKMIENHLEALK